MVFYIYELAKAKLDVQIQIAENHLNCREDTWFHAQWLLMKNKLKNAEIVNDKSN